MRTSYLRVMSFRPAAGQTQSCLIFRLRNPQFFIANATATVPLPANATVLATTLVFVTTTAITRATATATPTAYATVTSIAASHSHTLVNVTLIYLAKMVYRTSLPMLA